MHNKEYRVFKKVLLHIALLIVVLISIFPFIWMLTGATNKSVDVTGGVLRFGKSLGENWTNLQSSANVFLVFLNSMKITLIYTFVSILICSMAGYGFEKYRSKGKNLVYSLFLFSMMIPFSAQMIPLFKMASKANMLDSHTAVILPTLAMPFLVFFFRQSFQSYPTELIEAARIDGANEFTIFFRLVMAPMKSTFAAGAIYAFMKQWNNYLCTSDRNTDKRKEDLHAPSFLPCLCLLCRLRSVNVSHCPCNHTYYHCIPDNAEAICRRHCRLK